MNHAEVRDRLEAAALGRGGPRSALSEAAEGSAVTEHIERCAECRAEYEALEATVAVLAAGSPDSLRAPGGARERMLSRVATTGTVRDARPRSVVGQAPLLRLPARTRRRAGFRSLPAALAAAAVVAVVVAGTFTWDAFRRADAASRETAQLGYVATEMAEILHDPAGRRVELADPQGTNRGVLLFSRSSGELVVFATDLPPAPSGRTYRCLLQRDGATTQLGPMHLNDRIAYWAGSLTGTVDAGRPGDRFVVILDGADGSPALTGTF